jgi:hypothetical protein
VPTLAVFNHSQVEDQVFGIVGVGTKSDELRTSYVGLTSADNVADMLEKSLCNITGTAAVG